MTTKVRVWIASVTLAVGTSLIYLSGPSYAGDEEEIKKAIAQITDAIKKNDKDKAANLAKAIAKKIPEDELGNLMFMFKPRNKGGLGWGSKPLANPALDGIEVKIRDLLCNVPAGVAKEAEAGQEAGYWIAAIAEITIAKAPPKDAGKKTKKAWIGLSEEMREAGLALVKASAAKGAQEMKTAASKVNATCNNCHSLFKD